jgi:hypothetical protein
MPTKIQNSAKHAKNQEFAKLEMYRKPTPAPAKAIPKTSAPAFCTLLAVNDPCHNN